MSLVRPHYVGLKSLLEADSALKVRDSAQLKEDGSLLRDQYVILYPTGPDELDDSRYTKSQEIDSDAEFIYQLKAVAVTSLGCADVIDHVMAALVGKTPTVTGRKCDPVRYVQMTDVQPDFAVKPALYFSDIQMLLTSQRS